jgi:hypothetical protein
MDYFPGYFSAQDSRRLHRGLGDGEISGKTGQAIERALVGLGHFDAVAQPGVEAAFVVDREADPRRGSAAALGHLPELVDLVLDGLMIGGDAHVQRCAFVRHHDQTG